MTISVTQRKVSRSKVRSLRLFLEFNHFESHNVRFRNMETNYYHQTLATLYFSKAKIEVRLAARSEIPGGLV